jgi:hypothetical protein
MSSSQGSPLKNTPLKQIIESSIGKKADFLLSHIFALAEEALRKAVAEAIAEHRRNGVPIAIWRNGKVVRIPSDQIEVREPQVEYEVSRKKRK